MTLREFVESGTVGTRAQREAFETGLIEAHCRACEAGIPPPKPWTVLDGDISPELFEIAFRFVSIASGSR